MKKYSKLAVILVAGCCLFHTGQALAGSATFGDTVVTFDGYTNGTSDDSKDSLGVPQLQGMTVKWDDTTHQLLSVTIYSSANDFLKYDSLFINSNYTGASGDVYSWDYFVHSGGQAGITDSGITTTTGVVPNDGLYSVKDPNSYTYTMVSDAYAAIGREDHPNGIDSGSLTLMNAAFAPGAAYLDPSTGLYAMVYDFSSLSAANAIYLTTGDFVIAYTPYCANDVLLSAGKTGGTGTVPEPATMVLFGMGLTGLAGWQMRKNKRNS